MSNHPSDDELLATIARQQRPLPPRVTSSAKELFTWRTVDRELAELLSDSLDQVGAGVRSAVSAVRHLEFGSTVGGLQIDYLADEQTVVGEVVNLDATAVTATRTDGTTEQADVVDSHFQLPARSGPVRFTVTAGETVLLVTEWVTLG